jgi:hypothetical protein
MYSSNSNPCKGIWSLCLIKYAPWRSMEQREVFLLGIFSTLAVEASGPLHFPAASPPGWYPLLLLPGPDSSQSLYRLNCPAPILIPVGSYFHYAFGHLSKCYHFFLYLVISSTLLLTFNFLSTSVSVFFFVFLAYGMWICLSSFNCLT